MDNLGSIGQGDYGVGTALLALLLTLPRRLYDLFPYAAVIGSLMGLGALAASSELTALRAAGLSRQRIGGSAMAVRSEEHTSELQSLMRISYAVFCLKKKNK